MKKREGVRLQAYRLPRLCVVVSFIGLFIFATQSFASVNWWMWTPGGHVGTSTQSVFSHGYRPTQPIPFDHSLHAGKRGMQCEYCHSAARRSASAGVPPLNTCIGCHNFVNPDAENIKIIAQKFKNNEPMKWVKVNDLPDYVRFSHRPHVQAKDAQGNPLLNCQTCHGPVETMQVVEQFAPLQMGWCLTCHNMPKGTLPPNELAARNASASSASNAANALSNAASAVTAASTINTNVNAPVAHNTTATNAPSTCYTCHY